MRGPPVAGPSPLRRFALPALAALACGTLDLFWGLGGPASGFILSLCAAKLAAMVTVSAAIAIATPFSRPVRQIASSPHRSWASTCSTSSSSRGSWGCRLRRTSRAAQVRERKHGADRSRSPALRNLPRARRARHQPHDPHRCVLPQPHDLRRPAHGPERLRRAQGLMRELRTQVSRTGRSVLPYSTTSIRLPPG